MWAQAGTNSCEVKVEWVLSSAKCSEERHQDFSSVSAPAYTQGKRIVSTEEMCERIRAALSGRRDRSFVVMARTDALASEGLAAAVARAKAYVAAGAEMLFPEACYALDDYRAFRAALGPRVPVLANITEFGKVGLADEMRVLAHASAQQLQR